MQQEPRYTREELRNEEGRIALDKLLAREEARAHETAQTFRNLIKKNDTAYVASMLAHYQAGVSWLQWLRAMNAQRNRSPMDGMATLVPTREVTIASGPGTDVGIEAAESPEPAGDCEGNPPAGTDA